MNLPDLKPLHSSLNRAKLEHFAKMDSSELIDSLKPGQPGSLKAKLDGTVMDGHHRIKILSERRVNVNALPRENV